MSFTRLHKLTAGLLLTMVLAVFGTAQSYAAGSGQNGTTLDASVSVSCTSSNMLTGTVYVHNGGGVATQGLTITLDVTGPSGSPVYQSNIPVDAAAQPELNPGQAYSYPYSVTTSSAQNYKVTANVTIMNHSGSLGTPKGPSPSNTADCGGGVTVVRVARFSVAWRNSTIHFHWRMADASGVVGFALFAGSHRLTAREIPVHAGPTYSYTTHWSTRAVERVATHGWFGLHVMLMTGRQVVLKLR